ncbi:MAG: phosphonate C-P lyase system protein PhnL [Hyphomicrobiales bacterium]|nr:phosphonate C-P lyase system protein PhnL [Hyphomicrobiales bacterium]
MLTIVNAGKSFTLHAQGGVRIPVLSAVSLSVAAGEAVALSGPSGAGKSSLMRMIYGNYACHEGQIRVEHRGAEVDIARAAPRVILDVRRVTMGYISQFLRVIPRVPALDVVAEPMLARGADPEAAKTRARDLLTRLRIPERLWPLSPVTFSGGEQQRVNIARGFATPYPLMLLDEPTASLDAANRATVIEMIGEARAAGTAIVGIFHDEAVRDAASTRVFDLAAAQQHG